MKKILFLITILFPVLCFSQLHHEMISSQGKTKKITSGHYITQTIGQLSVIGNSEVPGYNIGQGFQQSVWSKLINISSTNIIAGYYPNPFTETVTFNFTNISDLSKLKILIFDTAGRLVYSQIKHLSNDGKITLNLNNLSSGSYLINLSNSEIKYFTKLVKK